MTRQHEDRLVIAQDALIAGQFLEEGVEGDILALGLVADTVGLGVSLSLQALLLRPGVSQDGAGLVFRLATDVFGQLLAFALIFGDLLVALAADAVKDGTANLRRVVEAPQANVDQLDAVGPAGVITQALPVGARAAVGLLEQPPAQPLHALLDLSGRCDADQFVQFQVADLGAKPAADALAENGFSAVGGAHGPNEAVDSFDVGDAPADIGADRERLVDGVALGIVRQQFRPGQVEDLEAMIEPLHRLNGPRQFEVQPGVARPVMRAHRLAELRHIDELGPIYGETG